MAYSDHGPNRTNPYTVNPTGVNNDPFAPPAATGKNATSGLLVALGLIVALVVGLSFVGGGGDGETTPAQEPAATSAVESAGTAATDGAAGETAPAAGAETAPQAGTGQ
ncbi:hypothetical protein SAMN05421853_104114 [Roseivivax halotolerans]|uniref:Uncharacterized protein n=1 Tax=Roseivivax halotolerans TaxID=93684 RepID=A0A1I5XTR4_9RHOB|nr:hypothetical protein [Roseivivax halotolerans]SFQ35363.1 hypothetical protein SAMN05421853_104114 [Roseivivax halotolerans]